MNPKQKKPSNIGGFINVDFKTCSEIDYMDKLTPEERTWYQRFLDNEYNARIHKDGKDVVTDREQQKAANRHKQRRLQDITNKCYFSDAELSNSQDIESKKTKIRSTDLYNSFGHQFMELKPERPRTIHWRSRVKPKRKKVKPASETTPMETINEFLARGGSVVKVK